MTLRRFVKQVLWSLGLKTEPPALHRLSNEDFVALCYQMILGRSADASGFECHMKALLRGVPREQIAEQFIRSKEFSYRYRGVSPSDKLHHARMQFVRGLPPADCIVDLGGASLTHPEGALFAMGYTHEPETLFIFDLPLEQRLEQPRFEHPETIRRGRTTIRYMLTGMVDLSAIPSQSVDMVFSGESIEHVTEDEADCVCREAYRVLKDGGFFSFDTPNARLTRLQSPNALIHPEHKKEYLREELEEKVVRAGFCIEQIGGLCPMERSVESAQFDDEEMIENPVVSDKPDSCYVIFFKCRKPSYGELAQRLVAEETAADTAKASDGQKH